jgi:hypothetical protein
MADVVDFSDPARFVFVISERLMTDKVAHEDFYNVLSIGNNF